MLNPELKPWRCGAFEFSLEKPLIMGILNMTPDSFSDGGEYLDFEKAITFAEEMARQGADIIDVGGESTRPGSDEVDPKVEAERVLEAVRELAGRGHAVSIDTRHWQVAQAALDAGACIVNDVSGFRDLSMVEVLRETQAGCVVMHMLGEPKIMQQDPSYTDVVEEVREYLLRQAGMLEDAGVARERICIDPGPGFGKTTSHNWELVLRFEEFCASSWPVMAATSRKNFIGKVYGGKSPKERVWGSVASALRAVCKGAAVARVHDVAQTKAAFDALESPARRAVVALGGNMGERVQTLINARSAISKLPLTKVLKASAIYDTEPAFFVDQASFANSVAIIETRLHPCVLLAEMQRIELEAGRQRSFKNAPRPLDLDLIDYEGEVMNTDFLTLPHPGALQRDFVVTPLLEVCPDAVLANGKAVSRKNVEYGRVRGKLGLL